MSAGGAVGGACGEGAALVVVVVVVLVGRGLVDVEMGMAGAAGQQERRRGKEEEEEEEQGACVARPAARPARRLMVLLDEDCRGVVANKARVRIDGRGAPGL